MNKRLIFLIKGVILLQAVLCLLLTLFLLSNSYHKTVLDYGRNEVNAFDIHLNKVAKDRLEAVHNYLANGDAFLIKENLVESDHVSKIEISVGGNFNHAVGLSFSGINLFNKQDLRMLNNANATAVLGQNEGSVDSIKSIPEVFLGPRIYVDKFNSSDVKNSLGNYTVVGLDSAEQQQFIKELSQLAGVSIADLSQQKSGFIDENGTAGDILKTSLLVVTIILAILFVIYTISAFDEIGILALLGWFREAIFFKMIQPFLLFSLLCIVANVGLGYFISGIKLSGISSYIMAGCMNLVLVSVMLLLINVIILASNTLKLIKKIIPVKTLYGLGMGVYIALSMGLVLSALALDGPIKEVQLNYKILTSWQHVANYQTLKSVSEGQDKGSLSGLRQELDDAVFQWYKSIEGDTGVYLASGQYYTKALLKQLDHVGVYTSKMPAQPFSLLNFSPNYVIDHHIYDDVETIRLANKGVRVYLMPKSWDDSRVTTLKNWLIESDTDSATIKTKFNQQSVFKFIRYDDNQDVFTWSSTQQAPVLDKHPVMLISTSENMNEMDYRNLRTSTLDGPLKFKNQQTLMQHTKPSDLEKHQLSDNHLNFVSVKKYVNGLQKDLKYTIELFGGAVLFVMLSMLLILIALVLIFNLSNHKLIFVKQLLGFSRSEIYGWLFIFISLVTLLQIIGVWYGRSKLGLTLVPINYSMQIIMMIVYIKRRNIMKMKRG